MGEQQLKHRVIGAEWGSLEEAPDPDEGVQEGFLEEVTFGSLSKFGGALEVWPRHWGLFKNLGMECVCFYGGGGGVRFGNRPRLYRSLQVTLKSLNLGTREPWKG